jgi:hypothetical protein
VEYSDLKIGDLIEFEIRGLPGGNVGLIMGVFEDPWLIGATICEIYLAVNDYVYLAEAELKCWNLLSRKENP